MALASTNAWKVNVEESIQSAIRSEFGASMEIFRSRDFDYRGNRFCIIRGLDSDSNNTMYAKLSSTYNLSLDLYMQDLKRNNVTVKSFFRLISRLEESIYSLLEIDPLFRIEIAEITYEDDIDFNGYRKASFSLSVRSIR